MKLLQHILCVPFPAKKGPPAAGVNLQLEEPLVMHNWFFLLCHFHLKNKIHPDGGLLGSWAVGSCWMSFWFDVVLQGDLSSLSLPHWLATQEKVAL